MKNFCTYCHQTDNLNILELPAGMIPRQTLLCPSCHRVVLLVSIKSAMAIVQRSRQTLYEWMRNGRIRFIEAAGGRRLIFYSSLFVPPKFLPEDADATIPTHKGNSLSSTSTSSSESA